MARGVIPIVGATRAEQMRENMAAAELQLSEDALADLHAASAFDAGHPYSMLDWDMPIALGYGGMRSEEHTSELQSLMRISYAVFCLKKKTTTSTRQNQAQNENFSTQSNTLTNKQ